LYKDLEAHLNSHIASLSSDHLQSLTGSAFFQLQTGLRQKRDGQIEVIAPQLEINKIR
jgi:hypothetical protein